MTLTSLPLSAQHLATCPIVMMIALPLEYSIQMGLFLALVRLMLS
jgi:hypothetical protein